MKEFELSLQKVKLSEGLTFQCGAPFNSIYFNQANNGIRLIKNRDLKSDDQIYYYSGPYSEEFIVNNGDLLIGMDGDFLPCLWRKGKALLNQRVGRIITNDWNKIYLYYILFTPLFEKQSGTGATTVKHLAHGDIESMYITMTRDLNEQFRIASALSSIDNLISSLDKLIEKKKNIKQGTMQQLLTGKKRLKGFTEPWEQKQMWEVTIWDKKFNGVASYMQRDSIKYPYVLANVFEELETHGGNVLLLSTGNYVGWTTEEKAGQHLCEGEVVAIPWGGVANVKYANGKFVTADNRIATSSDLNMLDNKYLYYQMLFRSDEINSFYRGASIKHPSMLDVLSMILQIPSIKEQKAIASVLTSMDNEISAIEAKKAKYESMKQGMMQQLLTGKIRLI